MTQNAPLVSIGLPVYNAGKLIRRAVNSLLAQDYPNFELIICDNASTDGTWDVIQEYQRGDARVKPYRNSTNIGATANFERVLTLATGDYFMWSAHDDWWEPAFISQCVARLEAAPEAMLCHVRHVEVDEINGKENAIEYHTDLENPNAWQRIYSLLTAWPMPNVYVYGLFRREEVTGLMPVATMVASDTILLLQTLQLGTIIGVDQPLHHYSVGKQGRGVRVYMKRLAPNISRLQALTWDWQLFFRLLNLSQFEAPTFKARLQSAWAAGRLVRRYTGWPLSMKMILNYTYILMPDALADGLRRWVNTHPRAEKFIMRLVGRKI